MTEVKLPAMKKIVIHKTFIHINRSIASDMIHMQNFTTYEDNT